MPTMAWYHALARYDWLPYATLALVCLTTIPLIRHQLRETVAIHEAHEAALEAARQRKLQREQHPEDAVPLEILRSLCASPVYDIRVAAEKIVLERYTRNTALVRSLHARIANEEEGLAELYEELKETLKARELSAVPLSAEERVARRDTNATDSEISPEENELIQRHEDEIYRRWRAEGDERIRRRVRRARREAVVVGSEGGDGQPTILISDVGGQEDEDNDDPYDVERRGSGEAVSAVQGELPQPADDQPGESSLEDQEVLSEWVEGYGDDSYLAEMPRPRYRVLNEEFEL